MKNILVINSSVNQTSSVSRMLVDHFVESISQNNFSHSIKYRDLAVEPPPHIFQDWVISDRKASEQRTTQEKELLNQSDGYIKELVEAELIVLASPMYNWSVPSHLKSYLDHVLRFNETFGIASADENVRYKGLLTNKKLLLILTRGSSGYSFGERNSYMDFQEGYIKLIFQVMGIDNITEVIVEGLNEADQLKETKIDAASKQVSDFVIANFKTSIISSIS